MTEIRSFEFKRAFTLILFVATCVCIKAQTDVTSTYINNPSFETDGTSGWTVQNMQTQNNSVFARKSGSVYLESWVSQGQQIGDAAISQILKNLPSGNYKLTASALHIQQTGSNSTTNKGAAQTGAYLYAGNTQVPVTAMKLYTLEFAVLDAKANVEIGLRAENATGNYLCVDNFKLQHLGDVTPQSYASEVSKLIDEGKRYIEAGIQQSVATTLNAALQTAQTALQGTGTNADGTTTYDMDALMAARTTLNSEIKKAAASRQLYVNLDERISYAEKVQGWWQENTRKAAVLTQLANAIATAREKSNDYTLTSTQLRNAVTTLNTRISAVDKKIYCSGSACGSDADLRAGNKQWSYERSMQSKHWILFWESGYGTAAPPAVASILETADRIFEFYADSLKFININSGKSKTDTYKMIIRLRYTTEWEASGSGIDNQIGLLTLSRWAYTSREGQTVAHEIGHCFQYQTHCDNNNQNGWMYNWGRSTLNVFWEMCAQWQAYKFYPAMQFNNEWLNNTLNGLHRHPLCVALRYENFFIQDYFCQRHGMDIIGRLWNQSRTPEDPLQAYMRLTMTGSTHEKLEQLGDEMWEYGARMTTFDMDHLRERGASVIGRRAQTALRIDNDKYWWPTADNCIENWGNNAIRLNAPSSAKTIYVEFEGKAGAEGYIKYNTSRAGWRLGFVALASDGTRIYSDMTRATYDEPNQVLAFDCPKGCKYVWLVVSGAPTAYWLRDWLSWSEEGQTEQWPYRVKFHQTNVFGKANNNTYPVGISDIESDMVKTSAHQTEGVFTLSGQRLRTGNSLCGLPKGLYIVGGRKVMKK